MKNEYITCKCTDLSFEGYGIAKYNDLVIFVKDLLPQEEAKVKIIKHAKNYDVGIIDELLISNPNRRKEDCDVAYKCGGCTYRHINYEYSLICKKKILENLFKDIDIKINDVIKCDNPLYYRNKTQVPCRDNKLGFYRNHSNDIVEFEDCLIHNKIFNEIIKDIKVLFEKYDNYKFLRHIFIRSGEGSNEIMLAFIVNNFELNNIEEIKDYLIDKYPQIKTIILNLNKRNDNVILGNEEKIIYGNAYITDIYEDIKVRISLKSFYQVNYSQMIKMYKLIRDLSNCDNKKVLDLYSGIGTISLFLSKYAKEVVGVEIVKEAVEDANINKELNKFDNLKFYLDDASKNMDKYLIDKDIIVVDPPRKGLSNELIDKLNNIDIENLIYVSCNPLTLKRDLNLLSKTFTFDEINPIDLFPFSKHIECVCLLRKKND